MGLKGKKVEVQPSKSRLLGQILKKKKKKLK